MRYGIHDGVRVSADKELQALVQNGSVVVECDNPACKSPLIAKCGEINTWHWAHQSGKDCDSWAEPETEWHRDWKNKFPAEWQEVTIVGSGKWAGVVHRADVAIPNGPVIEFQHSSLSADEIKEREQFYTDNHGAMLWVVDGSGFMNRWEPLNESRLSVEALYSLRNRWTNAYRSRLLAHEDGYSTFGKPNMADGFNYSAPEFLHLVFWPHARKSWSYALCPVFFDSGNRDSKQEVPYATVSEEPYSRDMGSKSVFSHHEVGFQGLRFKMEDESPEEFIKARPYLAAHPVIVARINETSADKRRYAGKQAVILEVFKEVKNPDEQTTAKTISFNRTGTRDVFEWVAGVAGGQEPRIVRRESIHSTRIMAGRYRPFDDVLAELNQEVREAA